MYKHIFFSGGTGRTGTFIALDAVYKEGERTGKVNVQQYVEKMRNARMNMIQAEVCLHYWKIKIEIQKIIVLINKQRYEYHLSDIVYSIDCLQKGNNSCINCLYYF